ncbi:hypothetical protein ACQCVO_05420 [Bacillus infantis]|uniref:hypothetical protein n=1 Tax=Bacillus infantis TaxID=324767 RepID=UPI003CFA31A8
MESRSSLQQEKEKLQKQKDGLLLQIFLRIALLVAAGIAYGLFMSFFSPIEGTVETLVFFILAALAVFFWIRFMVQLFRVYKVQFEINKNNKKLLKKIAEEDQGHNKGKGTGSWS